MNKLRVPTDRDNATIEVAGRTVHLTNLRKPFWKTLQLTKGDLIQYYADVARWLLPHLADRPMVMKRYPNGAEGEFFYMKRAPVPRPDWIQICAIPHKSSNVIDFALVQDLPALLWMVNLGCIDLHPWYGRCDDWDRPDFLHFDLDPVQGADFRGICEVALHVRDMLDGLRMPSYSKTTGSRGIHVYVPIQRGPVQKEVWGVAKALAFDLAARFPKIITAEYRVAKRPHGRVLVDYNQNAWGQTLASIYSVRPTSTATVSTPISWEEVQQGVTIEEFRLENIRARLNERGDLWRPLLGTERYDLAPVVSALKVTRPRSTKRQSSAA
jgi:bifunctional non-homologous end joining protein LigD